jgi:DNA polymerase I-like protein with 3'-5' exonuclease and polymerase domains
LKEKARKCCEPRFTAEMVERPGLPVLALGAVATRAFLGRNTSIQALAGSYHQVNADGSGYRAVIPTIHPAAILRGGAGIGGAHSPDIAFWNLMYDAAKVKAIAAGRDIVFREEDIVVEYADARRAEMLMRRMVQDARRERMVACDTETYVDNEQQHSALQPINAKLTAIGFATPKWGLSIAWNIVTPMAKRLMAALMADPLVRVVFHNSIYDRGVLKRHGMPVHGPVDDTLLKHHAAFPGLSHNLQRAATQYFAITPWKSEFREGKDTVENLVIYNAKDTLVTARLDEPLDIAIARTQSAKCYEIDLLCAEAAEWMYDAGIPVSQEVNQQLYDQFWQNMQRARAEIEEKANNPEIRDKLLDRIAAEQAKRVRKGTAAKQDPERYEARQQVRLDEIRIAADRGAWKWQINSSAHLAGWLKVHGLDVPLTKKGAASITKAWLKDHADKHPAIQALYAWRSDKENEALRKIVEDDAARPEIQEELWVGIAAEQAKFARNPKGKEPDPEDYRERQKVRLQELLDSIDKATWEWNVGSSDHIVGYLKARGVPLYFLTEKGSTSTKKEILESFAHIPEVRSLLDYRENQKLFSTFVYALFDRYDEQGNIVKYGYADANSRVHPRWNVHRITGRWSAEDPVCQNVPKADAKKGRPNLRKQFEARLGRILVGFDFAQLEARIIALLSGDPFLCAIFNDGKDIHSEFARIVWPNFDELPYERRKVLRDTVKRPEYGAFYGGSIDTLWKNVVKDYPDVKQADIARMVALMTARMPGVTAWHQKLLRDVAQPPHELRSAIYGRRRCFPLGNADMNDVYNFPVQSTGADIMATGLLRLMPKLRNEYSNADPIIQIHDAIVFECDEADGDRLMTDVKDCFEQTHTHNGVTIHFSVDPAKGRSWADV